MMPDMMMVWQYPTSPGSQSLLHVFEIQAATFLDNGNILVVYVEGDCDEFLPFVTR
jgi:membrane protease subunit (stomatin/prohibitin family)